MLNPASTLSPHHHIPDDTPPHLPCDRVSSTRPKVITYYSDVFQKAIGFCNFDKVLAKMKQVAQPTLKINYFGQDPMQDPGEMSTMPKKRRKTTPLQQPERFGDVVHLDILYRYGTAIGGYQYTLWFVDRRSKYIEQYPLKSLESDKLIKSLRLFRRDMGDRYPDKIIGDRNFNRIGGQVAADLEGINEYREEKYQSVLTGATAVR